jgi:hypothetical protein
VGGAGRVTGWAAFEAAEPDLAAQVRARFAAGKHCTMATLRADGSPRISGIEVAFDDGELVIGTMAGSLKAADLRRDPRVAVHSPTRDPEGPDGTGWPGEAKVAGRAVAAGAAGADGQAFRVDLAEVVLTVVGDPADHLVVTAWHPDRGVERHRRT